MYQSTTTAAIAGTSPPRMVARMPLVIVSPRSESPALTRPTTMHRLAQRRVRSHAQLRSCRSPTPVATPRTPTAARSQPDDRHHLSSFSPNPWSVRKPPPIADVPQSGGDVGDARDECDRGKDRHARRARLRQRSCRRSLHLVLLAKHGRRHQKIKANAVWPPVTTADRSRCSVASASTCPFIAAWTSASDGVPPIPNGRSSAESVNT